MIESADVGATHIEKPKKKKSKKDKAAVGENADQTAIDALKTPNAVPAAPRPKKTKAEPKAKETAIAKEDPATLPVPMNKGPSTVNVHAEKIKKLLGQKDEMPKQNKKGKKAGNVAAVGSTANGVNGTSGNSVDGSLEMDAKDAASTSMQAEAQRTTEKELQDEYDSDEGIDQAGALLEGFDSDSEDLAQDEGFDEDKPTAAIPNYKKTQKKLRQAAQKGNKEGPGAVYVGRIPHGFYENEMRQYFSQFGTISKLRLSRNRQTGHSKHFAFMEFESNDVAKIVAETMDNYLMFGHILKCKYVQPESLHPDTFKGANKRFRVAPHNRMEKRALEAPKSESQWTKKNSREQAKREKKAEKLKAMGYDIELPKLKNPSEVLQQKEPQTAEEEKAPDTAEADGKEAVPAPTSVPKDEVALSKKKSKKEKKGPDSAEAEGKDGSTLNAVPSDEVALSAKKSKKEQKGTKSSEADGKEIPAPPAVAKDELAPKKKKSKREKKEKTVPAETNGVTVPTADSNAHTPDLAQSQNDAKQTSEKRDKRKEKREKAKDEAKQLAPQSAADENPSTVNGEPANLGSNATMPVSDPTKAGQRSKQNKKKAKGETAQVATDDTLVPAIAISTIASVEKEASSSTVPAEIVEGGKSKGRGRARKSSTAGNELAESEPKSAQPSVTDPKEPKLNGGPGTKSMLKKAKKA